ncbi:N-acetylmuramoyl-L-alanine amidase LytC precursor [Streptomyces sp. YIM 130001]|uniref:N-acetylmuramoyl-L-alanine amidase n=1 Tax=Streptomyces sp. YIM 130001 TaxID=2259644 RepID=UPI000E6545CD|nr:N-acetylmuramoyl-L-alanine amidase [Streptomyces sp. YIM 130001]RII16998.1 N-acetylmuramoyl-L-alanine amidase LytC precursor [Streptomyces sp. YIM 130001]
MSYDDPDSPPPTGRRPFRRGGAYVAVAALVPAGLAGWLLWQVTSGSEEQGASTGAQSTASPTADSTEAPGSRSPSPSREHSGDKGEDDNKGDKAGAESPEKDGPLKGRVVVIDPGHNPNNFRHPKDIARLVDIGTNRKECDTTGTSTNDGYTEAEFTLDVAHRLRDALREQGASVRLTHDGDRNHGPCVDERARIGNEANADAVVSLHADGSGAGNRGFHVITPAKVSGGAADTGRIAGPSRDLGARIAGGFVRSTGSKPSNYIGSGTGLDVRDDLGGLNLSKVPKVFVECGNMRDPKDAALVKSADWRQKAANGISSGIAGFLEG